MHLAPHFAESGDEKRAAVVQQLRAEAARRLLRAPPAFRPAPARTRLERSTSGAQRVVSWLRLQMPTTAAGSRRRATSCPRSGLPAARATRAAPHRRSSSPGRRGLSDRSRAPRAPAAMMCRGVYTAVAPASSIGLRCDGFSTNAKISPREAHLPRAQNQRSVLLILAVRHECARVREPADVERILIGAREHDAPASAPSPRAPAPRRSPRPAPARCSSRSRCSSVSTVGAKR